MGCAGDKMKTIAVLRPHPCGALPFERCSVLTFSQPPFGAHRRWYDTDSPWSNIFQLFFFCVAKFTAETGTGGGISRGFLPIVTAS